MWLARWQEERLETMGIICRPVPMPNNPVQMNPSRQFCPNVDCPASGKIGHGNIVVHSKARPRYRCKTCGKTFSASEANDVGGLRKPSDVIVIVITLLAYGCPLQAIVHAYGLDEGTGARWRERAGNHCKQVHHALLEQGQLDLIHVQADEIRVKGRKMIAWMGLAMKVSTRLWVAGTISRSRDRALADRLLPQVRACARSIQAVLVCTDGWAAYPGSIQRAFREKVKATAGRGRASFQVWPELCIATVIKRTGEEAGRCHHPLDDTGDARANQRSAARLIGRSRPQHRHNSAFQWDHAGTARQPDAPLSACGWPSGDPGGRDASDRLHLQLLLAISGTLASLSMLGRRVRQLWQVDWQITSGG